MICTLVFRKAKGTDHRRKHRHKHRISKSIKGQSLLLGLLDLLGLLGLLALLGLLGVPGLLDLLDFLLHSRSCFEALQI